TSSTISDASNSYFYSVQDSASMMESRFDWLMWYNCNVDHR
ncbi:2008_t:CDS:1, partial [Dentiscutata heterogama]